jgi:hypothetical protein
MGFWARRNLSVPERPCVALRFAISMTGNYTLTDTRVHNRVTTHVFATRLRVGGRINADAGGVTRRTAADYQ